MAAWRPIARAGQRRARGRPTAAASPDLCAAAPPDTQPLRARPRRLAMFVTAAVVTAGARQRAKQSRAADNVCGLASRSARWRAQPARASSPLAAADAGAARSNVGPHSPPAARSHMKRSKAGQIAQRRSGASFWIRGRRDAVRRAPCAVRRRAPRSHTAPAPRRALLGPRAPRADPRLRLGLRIACRCGLAWALGSRECSISSLDAPSTGACVDLNPCLSRGVK